MAISTYTRAPKEYDYSDLNVDKQLDRFSNTYRQDQEKERQDTKQREATYLQQAKVDPIFNMSSYWQKEQGKKIQEFQNFLSQKYYSSKNRLNLQDQIEIQNHKAALYGWQQELQANQQKYAQAAKQIENDPYGIKYDKDNFESKVDKWKVDGKLDDDMLLPPRIGDRRGYYETKNWKGTKQTDVTDRNGQRHTVEVPMTDDEAKAQSKYDLFNPKNAGLYRTVTEDFAKLPIEDKKKYLDKYKGEENQIGDAVVDWNWDTAGKYAIKKQISDKPAPKGSRGSGYGAAYYPNESGEAVGNRSIVKNIHKPVVVGDITINNEDEYRKLALKKGQTSEERKALLTWSDQKRDSKNFVERKVGVKIEDGAKVPNNISISVPAKNTVDISTGKLNKDQEEGVGQQDYKRMSIEYLPWNGERWAEGDEYGSRENLKPGWTIKPFLIGRDDEEQEVNAKLLDKHDLEQIEYQSKGKWSGESVRNNMSIGKPENKVSEPSKANKAKSYTIRGKNYTHSDLLKQGFSEGQIQKAIKEGKIK